MSFTPNQFDEIHMTNYLMEINSKLKEISETIALAVSLDTLNDYDSQFYEIQRELYFFYAHYYDIIKQSKAGRSTNAIYNQEFKKMESYEQQIYLSLWKLYRQVVNQRKTPQHHDFLAVGDVIAQSFFSEFLKNKKLKDVKPSYFTYSKPLTFLGHGYNRYEYYTFFPKILDLYNMDIPIVSVSRSASGTVWSLLAVSHEIGHDVMGNIPNFQAEAKQLVFNTFRHVNYSTGYITMPIYDAQSRMLIEKTYSPSEIMQTIWVSYLDEIFADLMGIVFSGPAFFLGALELLGGSKKDTWKDVSQGPEEHPPGYLRGVIQSDYLGRLGFTKEVDQIKDIFEYVSDIEDTIYWKGDYSVPGSSNNSFEIDLDIMEDSAKRLLDNLLAKRFRSLGGNKINDIVKPFSKNDQVIVVKLAERLQTGDWSRDVSHPYIVPNPFPAQPKHILSASRWAASLYPKKAEIIRDATIKMILKNKTKFQALR